MRKEEYTLENFKSDVNGILKVARKSLHSLPRNKRKPFEVDICYVQREINAHTEVYFNTHVYNDRVVPLVHQLLDIIQQINSEAAK